MISLILFKMYQEIKITFDLEMKYSYDLNDDISQLFSLEAHEK